MMLFATLIMMLLVKTRNEATFAQCAARHTSLPKATSLDEVHIICPKGQTSFQKGTLSSAFLISSTYKPGSVVNGHQSSPYVTAELQSERFVPPLKMCRTSLGWGVASNRVYSGPMLP